MESLIVASTSMSIEKYFWACSKQRGNEHAASSQSRSEVQQEARVVSKVFSRAKNNVPRNEDRPLLYYLASIPLWCRQKVDRQCWHGPIGNSVRIWRLSFIFLCIKISPVAVASSPSATGDKSFLSSIASLFVALYETSLTCAQF